MNSKRKLCVGYTNQEVTKWRFRIPVLLISSTSPDQNQCAATGTIKPKQARFGFHLISLYYPKTEISRNISIEPSANAVIVSGLVDYLFVLLLPIEI